MSSTQISPTGIESFVLLLALATAVSLATRRIRVPYTVALVMVGLLVGHSDTIVSGIGVSRETILLLFLPPLLFEGTLAMDLATLRDNWREVTVLSMGVTAVCFLSIGAAAHFFLQFAWPQALLVGAIISPTDPVSVLALMRESGAPRRLSLLIEAESCFNDGIGVVLYLIVASVIAGHHVSPSGAVLLFLREAAGGFLVGLLLSLAVHALLARTNDHLTETMISLALAYGAYAGAERLHVSGIMAVIAAGLSLGNHGRSRVLSYEARVTLSTFWEVIAFIANSVLFLLMGLTLQQASMGPQAGAIVLMFTVVAATRQVSVYAAVSLMRRLGRIVPAGWGHFMGWAGLRGSIPIALAVGLAPWPMGPGVPHPTEVVSLVFGVVLLSLLTQGLTIRPLLCRLRLAHRNQEEEAFEEQVARRVSLASASRRLSEMHESGLVPPALHEEIAGALQRRLDALHQDMTVHLSRNPDLEQARRDKVLRALQLARRTALEKAVSKGFFSEEIGHRNSLESLLDETTDVGGNAPRA